MPPEETRFKKGQPSANPAGRPKHAVFDQAARAILSDVDPKLQKSGAERLVEQMFRRALQGSFKHAELLLGYAMGRPVAQNLNLTANVNNESQMSIEQVDAKLGEMFGRMGIPKPVWGPGGRTIDIEAVRSEIGELLEKREAAKKPKALPVAGTETVQ